VFTYLPTAQSCEKIFFAKSVGLVKNNPCVVKAKNIKNIFSFDRIIKIVVKPEKKSTI